MADSASIRYNNPGAMWDSKISKKWGSTSHVILADGQANHIAIFPSIVQGAAAQFDLWKSNYVNMKLSDAIKKWSGGNSSPAYVKFLKDKGISSDVVITPTYLASAQGLVLMKAQAQWEAGKVYPMSDADWAKAQGMVFKTAPVGAGMATGSIIAGTAATTVAASPHALTWLTAHWPVVLVGVLAAGILIDVIFTIYNRKNGNV